MVYDMLKHIFKKFFPFIFYYGHIMICFHIFNILIHRYSIDYTAIFIAIYNIRALWTLVFSQVARAGRFGTKGLAITFVSDEGDARTLNDVQDRFEVNISELPEEIDISSYSKSCTTWPFLKSCDDWGDKT